MRKPIVLVLLTFVLFSGCAPATANPTSQTFAEISPSSTASLTTEALGATNTPRPTAPPKPTATSTPTETATRTPAPTNSPTATHTPSPGTAGADQVLAFNPGPGAKARYSEPEALLAEPDLIESPCCQGIVQLGRGGSVLLAFTDNTIVDGEGADFQVYGESARDDYLLIEVSADGQSWYAYPKVTESPGALDLADVGLTQALYVRLTDLQPATSTGAEVDAVVALHSAPGPEDDLPDLPEAVARRELILHEGPHASMKRTGRVSKGATLSVVGRSQSAGWAKVETEDGKSGWCPVLDLALNVSLSEYALAPTVTPTPIGPQFTAEFLRMTRDYPCVVQFAERDTSDLSQILIRYYQRDVCKRHPDRQRGVLDVGERHNLWYQLPDFEHPEIAQGQPPTIGARIVKIREGLVKNGIPWLVFDVEIGCGKIITVWQRLSGRYVRLYGRHWRPLPDREAYLVSIRVARTTEISPKVFEVGDWVGLFIDSSMEKAMSGEADKVYSYQIMVDG